MRQWLFLLAIMLRHQNHLMLTLLYLGCIEVLSKVRVRERIWRQETHIVLVAPTVIIVHGLDLVGTEVICASTDCVLASGIALLGLVVAIARTVQVVVPLGLDRRAVRVVVVCVARKDGEVVVCLVMYERVEPTVADQNVLQFDLVGPADVLLVLFKEVRCEMLVHPTCNRLHRTDH